MHTCPHFLIIFSAQTMKIVILTHLLGPKKGHLGQGLSRWWSICLIFMPFHIQYPYHPINAYLSPLVNHFYCSNHENCHFDPLFGPKKREFGARIFIKVTLVGFYTFYVQYITVRNHFYHHSFDILHPCIVFLEPLFFEKMGIIMAYYTNCARDILPWGFRY